MGSLDMSEEDRQAFLADVHVAVLAIEREDRAPLAVPIWYSYELDGDVTILIGPASLKASLIEEAGRFSLCVQTEQVPYKYVMVEGPVVETSQCDVEAHARPMARRYLGRELGDQYIEDGDDSTSICITMRPEVWYSADYGTI